MIEPYWYEKDCLKAIARARRMGRPRILYTMASGTGKTITAALDVLGYRKERPQARTLFLCHQNRILDHARSEFEAIHGSQCSYGFYTGEEKTAHATEFLFASFQTMRKHCKRFRPDEFDVVYIDETHHYYAPTYLDVAGYWRPQTMVGMTATPDRTDGQDIRRFFGREVFSLPLDEALAHDILTPVDYRMLSDEISLNQVILTPGRRLSISKLNRSIFVPRRDEEIARIIDTHADKCALPRIIIFCESVAHCDHLAKYLKGSMPYHSGISHNERQIRLEMFRQGMVRALITRDIFNEGIDIPQANIIVFLRSTNSPLIFFQQLGRGLRKSDGKDKVTVLDFVGNCERIRMIVDLWENVQKKHKELLEKATRTGGATRPIAPHQPLMLNVNTIGFQEKILKILDIVGKRDFYKTWDEASQAAIKLGITSKEVYAERYSNDPRLPSSPPYTYGKSFPRWRVFLGGQRVSYYTTWKKAGKAALAVGIAKSIEYWEKRTLDPKLSGDPENFYKDWPGWDRFFGRSPEESYIAHNYYEKWRQAGRAARKLGIRTGCTYSEVRTADPRLPAHPQSFYKDFPGWNEFLETESLRRVKNPYPTWEEAGKAARAVGITSSTQYYDEKKYKLDPRLYAMPSIYYKDWPGWQTVLGTNRRMVKNPYPTWQEAGRAALALGITEKSDYVPLFKKDPRLYHDPAKRYKDFPGWPTFLGKK